ncbi:MAG: MBL fold metallo-hydrolase [Bacillota bacterium]
MYELCQVSDSSYYMNAPTKVGIVKLSENEVCLIDSGSDKDAGRKVRQILDKENWELKCILNTHSHADHIGGNEYLQKQKNCKIYIPEEELAFAEYPLMESAFLYGGFPPKDLRNKFLMAQPSQCEALTEETLPNGIASIDLQGHTMAMTGFRTKDDVVYVGDAIWSKEILEKYHISFLYDVEQTLLSLEKLKKMKAKKFVLAHGEPTESIGSLAQYNIDNIMETHDLILDFCKDKVTFEKLLQHIFLKYKIQMNFGQYVLIGSTVRSYLGYMKNKGLLDISFENAEMFWHTV